MNFNDIFNSREEFEDKYNYRKSKDLICNCSYCVHSIDTGNYKAAYHCCFLNIVSNRMNMIRTKVKREFICDLFE